MGSVKTPVAETGQLYEAMNRSFDDLERSRVVGEAVFEKPVLDLANRVIASVDALLPRVDERTQSRILRWKEDAEATRCYLEPPKETVSYSPEALDRMRRKVLYSMGVLIP